MFVIFPKPWSGILKSQIYIYQSGEMFWNVMILFYCSLGMRICWKFLVESWFSVCYIYQPALKPPCQMVTESNHGQSDSWGLLRRYDPRLSVLFNEFGTLNIHTVEHMCEKEWGKCQWNWDNFPNWFDEDRSGWQKTGKSNRDMG